ncbi:MAG TPA: hypothetical protein VFK48_01260 [Usitatibacter sp.]|nr:hypothetical protein [Usitatibacter sp.]
MSTPGEEAQRELERRALRNVRGLVDKIEADDKASRRTQVQLVLAIVIGAVVIALLGAWVLSKRASGRTVVIEQPKPGQVMPQAPRAPQ